MVASDPNSPQSDVLIVDDTVANLRVLSSMLSSQGYKVRGVTSGTMALTAVKAAAPALILLDIKMPEMDGYDVCRELKGDEQTRAIPVIFISAIYEDVDRAKASDAGGADFLTKPFDMDKVLACVEKHLA